MRRSSKIDYTAVGQPSIIANIYCAHHRSSDKACHRIELIRKKTLSLTVPGGNNSFQHLGALNLEVSVVHAIFFLRNPAIIPPARRLVIRRPVLW